MAVWFTTGASRDFGAGTARRAVAAEQAELALVADESARRRELSPSTAVVEG